MKHLIFSIFVIGVLSPLTSTAQKDFGAWIGAEVKMPLSKNLNLGLQIENRLKNNATEVNQSFISPYLGYKLHKHINLEMAYRFSNRPETGLFGSENVHRISLDASFKDLIDFVSKDTRLKLDVRLRYTHAGGEGDLNNDYFRTRFKLSYNLPKTKLKPHIATEFFYHFNDQLTYVNNEVKTTNRFNKYRLRFGLDYELNKRHKFSLFYIVQPNIESNDTDFILGLGYRYTIKKTK